ncbi:nitrous oxide reductase accessory protein NosL [Sulfurivermis fontis]|uniref:nitrous oxide reductase accessory protein NosL n=1 Tax=Sulfurivermis fontis TaxID=1972068 RepID=UPI0018D54F32|nr:nitrous oxide reductase accessory protein NosL [Sulfurivermis fontis]
MFLLACSGDPGTGPAEVKWDRDTCARCRMVLSDRFYAAQIRGGPEGKKTRVYKFDDIGCAVLWLEQQPWRNDPRTEIWVTDHRTGAWIDARSAHYVQDRITPMGYGLGAQADAAEGTLQYSQAIEHIHLVEQRFNSPEALANPASNDAAVSSR